MQRIQTLIGIGGHMKGQTYPLAYGKRTIIGRSRSADISLRKVPAIAEMNDEERKKDRALLTVSGRHFEITMYHMGSIEIINLSPNGTKVDGKPVDRLIVKDLAERSHEIAFGLDERFRLEIREHDL